MSGVEEKACALCHEKTRILENVHLTKQIYQTKAVPGKCK